MRNRSRCQPKAFRPMRELLFNYISIIYLERYTDTQKAKYQARLIIKLIIFIDGFPFAYYSVT